MVVIQLCNQIYQINYTIILHEFMSDISNLEH